ncbi:hypothetical protein LTR37_021406 [Vermiconidia calcicola]|uniref:Uncharacterized protein n=1 Tax=Vermiconidia calcicola TaxID=1690605 RepID=A0ACC3M8S1_9PEZI|nr:hypothetical protein LTR37_021406 [Vermiconidia calcicola]
MYYTTALLLANALYAYACPQHSNHKVSGALNKRQQTGEEFYVRPDDQQWAYDASYDWGSIDPAYELCQTGSQQSPIPLTLNQGLALTHRPTFDYAENITGNFYNWNYGAAFTLDHPEGEYTGLPAFTFEEGYGDSGRNETVYMTGWHIHSPADHTINGDRSRSELHYVHVDEEGHERVVLAILLDPSNDASPFFSQLPDMVSFNETGTQVPAAMNLRLALEEVGDLSEFWTYKGSLTSPPCHEGVRWFVGRQRLYTSRTQMKQILAVSRFAAREEQQVWEHEINV